MKYESDQEYHDQSGKPRVGSTALKTFIANPQLFFGQYIAKTIPMPEPIPAYAIGHAVEALVYGWGDKVITSDMATATSKAHKEAVASNPDKIVLTTRDYDLCRTMDERVRENRAYRIMMQSGQAQIAERIGMGFYDLQAKHDWIITEPTTDQIGLFGTDSHIIIDFKTTAKMRGGFSNFEKGVRSYGYIEQAALYQIIHHSLTGIMPAWFWLVVEKEQPFEVQMFKPDEAWLSAGRDSVHKALVQLKERFESGNWANSNETIETLYQPAWDN